MNILELVSSVSRIAIGAFVITLVVVGYEVYLLMKKRKPKKADDKEIKLPDFEEDAKSSSFTPINVAEAAATPVELQSRRISKPFLPILLGLFVLIILFAGYLIFRRNQVSSVKVDVGEVSPISQETNPEESGSIPLDETGGTGQGDGSQGGLLITPTRAPDPTGVLVAELSSTPIPTAAITGGSSEEGFPTTTPPSEVDTVEITPTTASEQGYPTSTPIPTLLPQAGTYQTTLIITVVAISVIYLALIL